MNGAILSACNPNLFYNLPHQHLEAAKREARIPSPQQRVLFDQWCKDEVRGFICFWASTRLEQLRKGPHPLFTQSPEKCPSCTFLICPRLWTELDDDIWETCCNELGQIWEEPAVERKLPLYGHTFPVPHRIKASVVLSPIPDQRVPHPLANYPARTAAAR